MKNIKFQIKLKSVNQKSLLFYKIFILNILKKLNIKYTSTFLPTQIKRVTFLKSPHINKTAREQFQIKTFNLLLKLVSTININDIKVLLLNKPKTIKILFKKLY